MLQTPEWDTSAKKKLQQQQTSIEILNEAKDLIQNSTSKVIELISKQEKQQPVNNADDYFKIFYENLCEVDNSNRDDCVIEIIECIENMNQ